MKIVTYDSRSKTNFFKELSAIFTDVINSNFIAKQLAKRDLKATYRQSLLGFFWAFMPIVMQSVVWIFISDSGIAQFQETAIPRPAFIIIGTTLWTVLLESINGPINSINSSKSIISKINFPKEALLLSGIYKLLFNAMLKMILIVFILFFFKLSPGITLVYFPLYLFIFILLGTAVGVLLAPIGLLYTDIGRAIPIVMQFLMYMTPVVFVAPTNGTFSKIFEYNPLSPLINSARNSLVGLSLDDPQILLYIIPISTIVLLLGLVVLRNSLPIIIEKISS